jgi:hypothetical protein
VDVRSLVDHDQDELAVQGDEIFHPLRRHPRNKILHSR